ncbi:MAG: cob(I)yrinic acid a,c-diamide adenosyltransferase [Planctomycetota bacterium]
MLAFTGDGKGKTTAALGCVMRAAGHGMTCLVIQFIKNRETGEHKIVRGLNPNVEIRAMGGGFFSEDDAEQMRCAREAAGEALDSARAAMAYGRWDIVVLDEVLYAASKSLVSPGAVRRGIGRRAPGTHVIMTGRNAPDELLDIADTVTEMGCVKHPGTSTEGIEQ